MSTETEEKLETILDMDRVRAVCKIGKGAECCRYLVLDGRGFHCGKLGEFKALLDSRVEAGTINARGDNCEGVK